MKHYGKGIHATSLPEFAEIAEANTARHSEEMAIDKAIRIEKWLQTLPRERHGLYIVKNTPENKHESNH